MSRIGRLPITIPQGVQVDIDGAHVQVKGPKGMVKAGMHRTGVNKMTQSELFDTAEPLKPGMADDFKSSFKMNCYEAVYGVVDYFFSVQCNTS